MTQMQHDGKENKRKEKKERKETRRINFMQTSFVLLKPNPFYIFILKIIFFYINVFYHFKYLHVGLKKIVIFRAKSVLSK